MMGNNISSLNTALENIGINIKLDPYMHGVFWGGGGCHSIDTPPLKLLSSSKVCSFREPC